MKNNKYKILVLSNLKEKSAQALSYAAKLSKEIDANVELFYVKAATEVIQTENALSAMRVLRGVFNQTDKKTGMLKAITSNYLTLFLKKQPDLKGKILDLKYEKYDDKIIITTEI